MDWDTHLPKLKDTATTVNSLRLVNSFKEAHLLDALAKAWEDVTQYDGVLDFAPSTSNRHDPTLQVIQYNLRSSILLLVETKQFDDSEVRFGAAAFLRSAGL